MEHRGAVMTGLVGDSPEMQAVVSSAQKVAASNVPVLLLGEKGTGKRLLARTIHQLCERVDAPFNLVDCNSIPEDLMEVEFFGHEKGAFTGAHTKKEGCIERSHGGTLFLNGIHALPLSLQAALVHYLEEKRVSRVGGSEALPVDTRLIAASDQDLQRAVEEARFRDDLYFTLLTIRVPPLRSRAGDVLQLADSFLTTLARQNGKKITGFLTSAESAMKKYGWPGNVRELRNRVLRAVVMAEGNQISAKDLELLDMQPAFQQFGTTLKEAREALDQRMIGEAITKHNGNVTKAAEELGISRPTMYELMNTLGIPRT